MMKPCRLGRSFALILLVAAVPAFGQQAQDEAANKSPNVVDMSTIKCSDLLAMPNDQAIVTLVRMKGFYSGIANDPTWDREASLANAKTLLANCKDHGALAVMTVIEQGGAQSGGSGRQ
jgi:hypothetical protein